MGSSPPPVLACQAVAGEITRVRFFERLPDLLDLPGLKLDELLDGSRRQVAAPQVDQAAPKRALRDAQQFGDTASVGTPLCQRVAHPHAQCALQRGVLGLHQLQPREYGSGMSGLCPPDIPHQVQPLQQCDHGAIPIGPQAAVDRRCWMVVMCAVQPFAEQDEAQHWMVTRLVG